jgi:hypothetical protein
MVMEYGVLQHVRQSRSGSEGMLEDYCFSAFSEGIHWCRTFDHFDEIPDVFLELSV